MFIKTLSMGLLAAWFVAGGQASDWFPLHTGDLRIWPKVSRKEYFVQNDCVYRLDGLEWPDFGRELAAGHLAPDYCFPLAVGEVWGAPH